jgi:hypothetical protein
MRTGMVPIKLINGAAGVLFGDNGVFNRAFYRCRRATPRQAGRFISQVP